MFHAGPTGYGWNPHAPSISQVQGSLIHGLLYTATQACWTTKTEQDQWLRDTFTAKREAFVKGALLDYKWPALLALEQHTLAEGLAWAWRHHVLPILKQEWELVCAEREFTVKIGAKLQMSRPDMILRNKATGALSNHDFKTTSSKINDYKLKGWFTALQMAIGCDAVAKELGEPVSTYYIHSLSRGGRGVFKQKGNPVGNGWEQQYSHLCYANFADPLPPVTDATTVTFDGYWMNKTPVWDAYIVGKPEGWSNVEWVAKNLPNKILSDIFALLGPYPHSEAVLNGYLQAMPVHEDWWIKTLWELFETESVLGWEHPEFQELLSRLIPRSYNCNAYNAECPMKAICLHETGWQSPEKLYKIRVPHHAAEYDEYQERVG